MLAILLLNKKEGGGLGRFGRGDLSGFEVFIDELFACRMLRWVERIGLGSFGYERVLEFDRMIVGARGGEPCILLVEYICVLLVRLGERDFCLLQLLCLGYRC